MMYNCNMLTNEDIKKIVEATTKANKEIFATKADFEELRKDFSNLQTSVDSYAKRAEAFFQEMVMLSHKVNRLEGWIKTIADKVGVKLEA